MALTDIDFGGIVVLASRGNVGSVTDADFTPFSIYANRGSVAAITDVDFGQAYVSFLVVAPTGPVEVDPYARIGRGEILEEKRHKTPKRPPLPTITVEHPEFVMVRDESGRLVKKDLPTTKRKSRAKTTKTEKRVKVVRRVPKIARPIYPTTLFIHATGTFIASARPIVAAPSFGGEATRSAAAAFKGNFTTGIAHDYCIPIAVATSYIQSPDDEEAIMLANQFL